MKKNYEYLLQRPEHIFDEKRIEQELLGRRVLVTGAGGSIGSAVARRLVNSPAAFVGLVGHSELPIFNLKNELGEFGKIGAAIASVADSHVMAALIDRWEIDTIIHAAAYKHVGLMESQPAQAFANNTLATISLAKVALASKTVRRFLFVSTDKAVLPTSIMGSSKRVAEVWLKEHAMPFATICRFGNVLGSSGSLVEIIENKLVSGEPIYVTDTRMERFFITPKEATGLVLTAAFLEEGDCFSIDMGKPIPIMDIIETMAPRHPVIIVGKPGSGEKLSEEVVAYGETTSRTSNKAVVRISMKNNPRIDSIVASIRQHPTSLLQEARPL
jgi:FlaA1/EpsC-like NDP-sugar epimerase